MKKDAKSEKIWAEVVDVTPEIAREWLENKCPNRDIKDSKVREYAEAMRSGRWGLTHQGIAFNQDNQVMDGQHRLWAVVESNTTIRTMVFHNVQNENMVYIDDGLVRSVVDVVKLSDPESNVTPFRVAVARRMLIGTRTQTSVGRQTIIEFLKTHENAITFAISDCFLNKRIMRVTPAAVPAVVARAWYHEDSERLKAFGKIMLGDMPGSADDKGAYLLREWLLSGAPSYGVKLSRDVLIYMKAQRGLLAFLRREQLRSIYPLKDEQWSLPLEVRRTIAKDQRPKSKRAVS